MRALNKTGGWLSSLKTRILVCYALTAALTITAISAVIGYQNASWMIESSKSAVGGDLALIEEKLDTYFDNIESYALYMIYARQWQRDASGQSDAYENFTHFRMVYAFLLDLVHANSDFQSVAYYEDDNIFISDAFADKEGFSAEHLALVEAFRHGKEVKRWYGLHPQPYRRTLSGEGGPDCYSLLRKCYDQTGKLLGIIELSLSQASVAGIYSSHQTGDTDYFIVDEAGRVCSSPDGAQIGTDLSHLGFLADAGAGKTSGSASEGGMLYTWRHYPRMGWTLVGTTPEAQITRSARATILSILTVGSIAILVSILIFAQVANHITGPINTITATVGRIAQGDYDQHIPLSGGDEISVLARQINTMTENTRQLMRDIEVENQEKRRFELSYIQSQMNPHFLYNSLETLCGMVEMGESDQTIRFVGDISRFYRSVLTHGQITVTLRQELDIVDAYLTIMRQRYPGRFEYKIEVDEAALGYAIPKLTLQPIVENAVVHGCIPHPGKGLVTVRGHTVDGAVRISVADDGAGMDGDKLQAVRAGRGDTLGFGFSNTERRLKLQLGADARVAVHSQPGSGTEVIIYLPLGEEGTACINA